MTSTNFNIGLNDATRPSSRVLRPPGGGHTDIFGDPGPQPVKKDNGRNVSSILEGTNTNTAPSSPTKTVSQTPKANSISEPVAAQPMQRGRVPPGGFSSGLW